MHAKPVDAHLFDGPIRVLLAPVPKLLVQTGRSFGEAERAGFGQAKIVNIVVCPAKAGSLDTFAAVISQPVRDGEELPPIKRHPESRNRTRVRQQSDGNYLTTTHYQKTAKLVLGHHQNWQAIALLP